MDDLFSKPERKQVRELNLVPVIDMFTTVIFFLILSTSFFSFTKLTLPPSKVSINTDPLTPPPLSTRLVIGEEGGRYRYLLSWVGESPGEDSGEAAPGELESRIRESMGRFKQKFPNERTVQLGLAPGVDYQALIRAMDGARDRLPDVVLISPEEAAIRLSAADAGRNGGRGQ